MNRIAARLVTRLLFLQFLVGLSTDLLVVTFAPRLLLLDREVIEGTWTLALEVAGARALLEALATLILTRKLRPQLRALALGTSVVAPAGLQKLHALPARLTGLALFFAAALSIATLVSPLRPTTNDPSTQLALVTLTLTMVSAAAPPLYIFLRKATASVLAVAPPSSASEAIEQLDVRRAGRVHARLLGSVAGPVAFVALGATLLVYAHTRAFDMAARQSDAAELARGVLEPVNGNEDGLREAAAEAAHHGLQVTLEREPATFTRRRTDEGLTQLTVPLDAGHAEVQFATSLVSPIAGVYVALALAATALAAFLGARLGAAFTNDIALATREVRATGVADVLRGARVSIGPRHARFVSIERLLTEIDRLGGVFRDFASAQEKLIVARAASERMRALFLASISHDLKGPLNSILGFTEIVRTGRLTDGQLESLAIIEQRGRELLSLIQTVLDSARAEAGELAITPEAANVSDVVMSTVLDAREIARGDEVAIVAEIQPDLPAFSFDAHRILQALTAVTLTAVRLTDKGTVQVRAGVPSPTSILPPMPVGAAFATSSSAPASWLPSPSMPPLRNALRFDVETAGQGVSMTELEKIFEAFKDVDSARRMGGLGLGLSLARSLAELHGGSLEAEPREAGGVRFRLTVPAAAVHLRHGRRG